MPPDMDSTVSDGSDVGRTGTRHSPGASSEVVPLAPVIEILQTPAPGSFSALHPPFLALFLPKQAFCLLLICSSPNDNCLLWVVDEYLRVRHLVEHLSPPLRLFAHLNPYLQSFPAAVVRRPCGNTAFLPLGLLNLPVLEVALLPEGPSPQRSELALLVAPLTPQFLPFRHL